MTSPWKIILGLAAVSVVAFTAYTFFVDPLPEVVITSPFDSSRRISIGIEPDEETSSAPTIPDEAPPEKPGSVRLKMPFASQAPTGNWDPPYDEACEEASLIIVRHYMEGTALDPTIMNQDILAMVDHEEGEGLPVDIDMFGLAQVARDMFGYDAEVVEGNGVTIERIEREIARGVPVILPLAGQDIGNPYYSGDGPPYHVLVVVGYGSSGSPQATFTTHDVGTKRGEYYVYDQDVLMAAIHDWNGSVDTIRSGPRRMLIVTK